MIAAEIREGDYRIAGSWTAFMGVGEFGPLPCGCCIVATEFDPVGPRLVVFDAAQGRGEPRSRSDGLRAVRRAG